MAEALVAGTGLQVLGNLEANAAQAQAERENAAFLFEQADFLNQASFREQTIFKRQADLFLADQISAFNKSGVELDGSALALMGETDALINEELRAIRENGRLRTREALLKGTSALKRAALLDDPVINALQATGTILTGTAPLVGEDIDFGLSKPRPGFFQRNFSRRPGLGRDFVRPLGQPPGETLA